ncbi:hypothetical protein PPL_08352 [Heterostelium album PN500]|uniref:Uncharacterized protein n=1 Tax=Heterostelium pallidum (strain ATCC 26659 / Pp 5 / PN500) TaxID=670386 RepID=D3BHY4_HETP5|nr:hypothetical protein PPL_08352 [Heterostelium album PN500]EFA78884.1 hypothetical protein PPL_08352 [Heterostelium album PN500]|eukprot:XP_020431008.1 hypothetical protein PPL_08352 [Heterostelium album PN500]
MAENDYLIPRGSYAHKVALKGGSDLDVDLILPRSFATLESVKDECDSSDDPLKPFTKLCLKIKSALEVSIKGLPNEAWGVLVSIPESKGEESTRSIKLTIQLHNTNVNVHLFPKLLDKDGKICNIGPKQNDGSRNWIRGEYMTIYDMPELTDEGLAALLLLKLWKKNDLSANQYADQNQSNEPCKRIVFSRFLVSATIKSMVDYLIKGFSYENSGDVNYVFATAGVNPFWNSTDHEERALIVAALIQFKEQFDILSPQTQLTTIEIIK